jgi:hypothetical protein
LSNHQNGKKRKHTNEPPVAEDELGSEIHGFRKVGGTAPHLDDVGDHARTRFSVGICMFRATMTKNANEGPYELFVEFDKNELSGVQCNMLWTYTCDDEKD